MLRNSLIVEQYGHRGTASGHTLPMAHRLWIKGDNDICDIPFRRAAPAGPPGER